ncbi:hypothetical protein Tco_0152590 [Tanacetum coccineum]
MDDPNINMEEYIRLEEEKARRCRKVFNWETATYGKIWDNEDVHDLGFVETEFPTIVFKDTLTSKATLSCEPTVSSLNDEIDFRIYRLTNPTMKIACETSLSKCDEEEENVLYFNGLFRFNVIYPYDSKSDKDNDDDEIDIKQFSRNNETNTDVGAYAHGSNKLLKTNYYSEDQYAVSIKKIWRIRACTHQRPQKIKEQYAVSRGLNTSYSRYGINIIFWKISNVVPTPRNPQYAVTMDDLNITMEEYIRLEEEKSHRHGKGFNWETAMYENDNEKDNMPSFPPPKPTVSYFDDLDFFKDFKTEFPAIVYNIAQTSKLDFLTEPTLNPQHIDEFDLKSETSLSKCDEEEENVTMDDLNITMEEYIRLEEEKSHRHGKGFNWETAMYENDNEKDNMPSFPPPKPTVSYFDDLDFFKDFKTEFPAIVYNIAQTSKLDFLTEPTLNPQHIDEFDLKSETSLSKCDEEEENVLYFNDLFRFNVIYPDDSKSDKDNDDEIYIKQFSRNNVINIDVGAYAHGSNKLLETSHDTSNKFFKTGIFIKELFNIMI